MHTNKPKTVIGIIDNKRNGAKLYLSLQPKTLNRFRWWFSMHESYFCWVYRDQINGIFLKCFLNKQFCLGYSRATSILLLWLVLDTVVVLQKFTSVFDPLTRILFYPLSFQYPPALKHGGEVTRRRRDDNISIRRKILLSVLPKFVNIHTIKKTFQDVFLLWYEIEFSFNFERDRSLSVARMIFQPYAVKFTSWPLTCKFSGEISLSNYNSTAIYLFFIET